MAETQKYVVGGVCCSTEEAVLRKCLDRGLGGEAYDFSLVTSELTVRGSVEERRVLDEVRKAGFQARPKRNPAPDGSFLARHEAGIMAAVALILTVAGVLAEHGMGDGLPSRILLGGAILLGGWRVAVKAFAALRSGTLDMNVLMSAAVLGAVVIGEWAEAAAVIVLFAVSLMLETYSAARTRRAVEELITLSPELARLLRNGREEMVAADVVKPGDRITVRPGERIPLDGVVVAGESTVNEAPITGESQPATKRAGDRIFAGSINGNGPLVIDVTRRFEETTLARMVHLIEEAHHQRAPVQRFIDRFARVYTPAVFAAALLVAVVPPLVLGAPFVEWVYRALVLLVIACPCALVISTPVTIVSALTAAARRGILIKGGRHVETLSATRAVAFDKTGTLTAGQPRLTDILTLGGMPRQEVLRMVAAIERQSEHQIALAVMAEAERGSVAYDTVHVGLFEAVPGRGVRARVEGVEYVLGNRSLAESAGIWSNEVAEAVARLSGDGSTAVVFGREGQALAVLGVRDEARDQSRVTVSRLRAMGMEHIVLLSGDHAAPTGRVAERLGIESAHAGLLPEQKVEAIDALKRRYGTVAMVGDGLNDAPALAASSVGIAMGVAGSDAALETADVVLITDDLSRLPPLFSLSRAAMRVVRQNIALALALKGIFLVLALTGYASLWMAVLADDGAALAVIANGLRLLKFRGE